MFIRSMTQDETINNMFQDGADPRLLPTSAFHRAEVGVTLGSYPCAVAREGLGANINKVQRPLLRLEQEDVAEGL